MQRVNTKRMAGVMDRQKMNGLNHEEQLNQLMIDLADSTRDLPPGKTTDVVRDRAIAVIRYLEQQTLLPQANWNLETRFSLLNSAKAIKGDEVAAGDIAARVHTSGIS